MPRSSHTERSFWQRLRQVCVWLTLLLLFALVWLSAVGFPKSLLPVLTKRLSNRSFAYEAESAHLDLWRGLILENARVFRCGVVGPPAIEAESVHVAVELGKLSRARSCVTRVVVRDARVYMRSLFPRPGDRPNHRPRPKQTHKYSEVHVALYNCETEGLTVESASCRVRSDGRLLYVDALTATVREGLNVGTLRGNFSFDPGAEILDMHLESQLDPHILAPIIACYHTPTEQELLRRFEFGGLAPRCTVDFRKECKRDGVLNLDGTFSFANGSYRDVPLQSAEGHVRLDHREGRTLLTLDPLHVTRPEGNADVALTLDSATAEVNFKGTSTLYPPAVAQMIGIMTNTANTNNVLRYDGPVKIEARGVADMGGGRNTDIVGTVEARRLGVGPFTSDTCSFNVHVMGNTNVLSDIRGQIYEGSFSGDATFVAPDGDVSNTTYDIVAAAQDVNFDRMLHLVDTESKHEYKGIFYGNLSIRGVMGKGNARTAHGQGEVGIKHGHVYRMPLFGEFSDYMTKIIPGLDLVLSQSDAKADVQVIDGTVRSEDIRIKGDVISLNGHGSYAFDNRLDYEVQVRLLRSHTFGGKILKPILYPLSKLFEFRLKGTPGDPKWYLINFSSELLEKFGLRQKTPDEPEKTETP